MRSPFFSRVNGWLSPFLYIWRLVQAITIDNRPIGTSPGRILAIVEPHRFVGSMTNNSHNGPSFPTRVYPLSSILLDPESSFQPFQPPPSCYTRPDRFRQFYIHVRASLIYYNVCCSLYPPPSPLHFSPPFRLSVGFFSFGASSFPLPSVSRLFLIPPWGGPRLEILSGARKV